MHYFAITSENNTKQVRLVWLISVDIDISSIFYGMVSSISKRAGLSPTEAVCSDFNRFPEPF